MPTLNNPIPILEYENQLVSSLNYLVIVTIYIDLIYTVCLLLIQKYEM